MKVFFRISRSRFITNQQSFQLDGVAVRCFVDDADVGISVADVVVVDVVVFL